MNITMSRDADLFDEIRFVDSLMHYWPAKAALAVLITLMISGFHLLEGWLNIEPLFRVRPVLVQGVTFAFIVEFSMRMLRAAMRAWGEGVTLAGRLSHMGDRLKTALLDRMSLYGVMIVFVTFSVVGKNMAAETVFEGPADTLMTLVYLSMLIILGLDAMQSIFGSAERGDDFLRRLTATFEAIKERSADPLQNDYEDTL